MKTANQPIVKARIRVVVGGRSQLLKPTPPIIVDSAPCLGLRANHNALIPQYISRALTEGAGSQSESHIAAKLFGGSIKYSELGDEGKQLVQAEQVHSRTWTINCELRAIYSTNCGKVVDAKSMERTCPKCLSVLALKALKIEPTPLASKRFIPHQWRTAATDLAINLAEINGLPGLLEAVS